MCNKVGWCVAHEFSFEAHGSCKLFVCEPPAARASSAALAEPSPSPSGGRAAPHDSAAYPHGLRRAEQLFGRDGLKEITKAAVLELEQPCLEDERPVTRLRQQRRPLLIGWLPKHAQS